MIKSKRFVTTVGFIILSMSSASAAEQEKFVVESSGWTKSDQSAERTKIVPDKSFTANDFTCMLQNGTDAQRKNFRVSLLTCKTKEGHAVQTMIMCDDTVEGDNDSAYVRLVGENNVHVALTCLTIDPVKLMHRNDPKPHVKA